MKKSKIIIFILFNLFFSNYLFASNYEIIDRDGDQIWLRWSEHQNALVGGSSTYNGPYVELPPNKPGIVSYPADAIDYCSNKNKDTFHIIGDYFIAYSFNVPNAFVRFICAKNANEVKIKFKDYFLNDATQKPDVSNKRKIVKRFLKRKYKNTSFKYNKLLNKNLNNLVWGKTIFGETYHLTNPNFNRRCGGWCSNGVNLSGYTIAHYNNYSLAKAKEIQRAQQEKEREIKAAKEIKEREKQKTKEAKEKEKEKPKKKEIAKKPEKKITKSAEVDTSLITIGSGSGFYINNKGYALTNNHVIDICKQSVAIVDGKETLFRVIATDKTNDVAVLKTDLRSRNYIRINEDGAKLGENVIAVGYPLAGRLSDSVKITRGIVSSTSGLNNNIGQIQIDAALQPGNSGGPVLNENGELVGIASAGLNKLLMAKEAKYIPENVNFAVASPIVVNILKSKKIKYSTPSMFSGSYSNTELAELGNSSTIQLFCRNTRTAYNRLKSSNKYSTVLLDLD